MEKTLKTVWQFPAIFLLPAFSYWVIGPNSKLCCCGRSNKKLSVSFFHSWINILVTISGQYLLFRLMIEHYRLFLIRSFYSCIKSPKTWDETFPRFYIFSPFWVHEIVLRCNSNLRSGRSYFLHFFISFLNSLYKIEYCSSNHFFIWTSTQNNFMCSKCIQDVESRKNIVSRRMRAS